MVGKATCRRPAQWFHQVSCSCALSTFQLIGAIRDLLYHLVKIALEQPILHDAVFLECAFREVLSAVLLRMSFFLRSWRLQFRGVGFYVHVFTSVSNAASGLSLLI